MKIDEQQRKTAAGLVAKSKAGNGLSCTKSGASIVKTTKQRHKTRGNNIASSKSKQSEHKKVGNKTSKRGSPGRNSIEIRGQLLPFPTQPSALQAQGTSLQKAAPEIPTLLQGRSPECSRKLKLQLFPVDEVTREVLDKDKHNPYLELTLGTQKKISSVVKHLNTKWGNSNAASGELMLFPFSARLENLAVHRRWEWKDSGTTAGDVYAAVGKPAVFRLRYGWFMNPEPNGTAIPLTPIYTEDYLLTGENKNMRAPGEKEHHCAESSKGRMPASIDSLNQGAGAPIVLDTAIQTADKDNQRKCNGSSLSWLDGLSNISFGALLSDVSPTRNTSQGHSLPNTSSQQIPNFDSIDAALAALMARQQGTDTSIQASSIWDAEETCHPFPFQKSSLSGKEVRASSRDAPFVSSNQNIDPNIMRSHNMAELQTKEGGCPGSTADLQPDPQDGPGESSAKMQLHSQGSYSNDNYFGKMDINWPESLGPFQYAAAPSSGEIIGSGKIGLSGLIESSLDSFQNFSIF